MTIRFPQVRYLARHGKASKGVLAPGRANRASLRLVQFRAISLVFQDGRPTNQVVYKSVPQIATPREILKAPKQVIVPLCCCKIVSCRRDSGANWQCQQARSGAKSGFRGSDSPLPRLLSVCLHDDDM